MFRSMLGPAVVAGLLLGSQAAVAESRVALVIGQSAYRAVTPLPNPANDAKAVTQLLGDAGFEVMEAADLSQNDLRRAVGDFAAKIAQKGPDTVALMFYAGHGLQVDGENFLMPVDIDPKREADIPLQAVRLNDVLNTLTSVPSKSRIILLDACRNNPFPEIGKTTGRRAGAGRCQGQRGRHAAVLFDLARRRSRGRQRRQQPLHRRAAEGGTRARAVDRGDLQAGAAGGQPGHRGPADAVGEFVADSATSASSPRTDTPAKPAPKRSVEEWKTALKGKPVAEANDLIVADGGDAPTRPSSRSTPSRRSARRRANGSICIAAWWPGTER